jgi:hypothetical protein
MDFRTIRSSGDDDQKDIRADLTNEAKARAKMEAMKARARASEEGIVVKHQLGETMLDMMEDYFPEEVASRRREDIAKGFVAGLAVGLASRLFWKR